MYNDLSRILEGRVDPELYAAINAVTIALEKHKAIGWKDMITRLMINNDSDAVTLVDRARDILSMQVEALFQQMKIKLNTDEMTWSLIADIIEALVFEPNDDDADIQTACLECEDPIDGLCNILSIKLNKAPEEFMEYVLEVSIHTIQAIESTVTRSVDSNEGTISDLESIIGSINRYQLVTKDGIVAMEAMGAGVKPGVPMELLVETYKERFDPNNPEKVVDDLVSLALLSGTSKECIEDEVCFFLEQIYLEIFDMQKVRKILTKRLASFNEGT